MSRVLYYLILKPLSLLPLPVLHLFSDLIYFFLFKVVGYRKKVVYTNLRRSFPEKTEKEIASIASAFYGHLCDMIAESIRIFSISREESLRRCKVLNPEVSDRYAAKGQGVLFAAGHYAVWEMAATSFAPQFKHLPVGLIAPVKDKFFFQKFVESRTKFGTGVVVMQGIADYMESNKDKLIAPVFIGDQSPSSAQKKLHWTTFLNQDTPVMLGAEKYAKQYNLPVIFLRQRRVKRGYYTVELIPVEENPQSAEEFSITEKHTRLLEQMIKEEPQWWLWSHRRWKHARR